MTEARTGAPVVSTDAGPAPLPTVWDVPPKLAPRATVLLLPGRGEDPLVYERFGRRLAADAYPVRVLADPSRRPEEAAAQVRAALAETGLPGPVVLAGSDAGALFAVGLAASGEVAVDALVLAGLPVQAAVEPQATGWEDELATRTACPTHRGRLAEPGRVAPGALFNPLPREWYERADLSKVTVPVLGLHGTADPVSPLAVVRSAYAAAPHAELVSLADGRHDAFNDISHRTGAATVVLFLERLRQGGGLAPIAVNEQLWP